MPLLKNIYKHAHTLTTVTTPSSHTLWHDWTHIAQHTVTKFELFQYTALKLITHPGTWLDTHCSAHGHKVWTIRHGTQNMQVFTQHWDWGTCLSVRSIQLPFRPGMWSLHLHREAPTKSVGFLLKLCSQLGTCNPNHLLHPQPTLWCALHPENALCE